MTYPHTFPLKHNAVKSKNVFFYLKYDIVNYRILNVIEKGIQGPFGTGSCVKTIKNVFVVDI